MTADGSGAPKPQAPAPCWSAIHPNLTERAQWVLWRYVLKGERYTKVPYRCDGGPARSTDPATWSTFADAQAAYGRGGFDGIGFMTGIGDGFVLIDLDHVLDPVTGELAEWAAPILAAARREGAYIEVSPSGTGFHIIGRGPQGFKGLKRHDAEAYCAGRYFTITGDAEAAPAMLGEIVDTLRLVRQRIEGEPKTDQVAPRDLIRPTVTDAELIERARRASNGARFSRLFDGDAGAYQSPSEADLALAGMLAFWCGPNPDRIEPVMRTSGLRREKWDELRDGRTYLRQTIEKALEGRTEFHEPGRRVQRSGAGSAPDAETPSHLEVIRSSLLEDLAAGPDAIDQSTAPDFIVHGRLPVAGANLAGAGGAGKTTAKLNECVHIVGGGKLYGSDVLRPGPCVLVTAEDGVAYPRYILRRVLEDGLAAGAINPRIAELAKASIKIVGWPRSRFGPIATTDRDGAVYRAKAFDVLLEVLAPLQPVYVTLDPAALFSPGERFGNDGEAFLASMMHEAGLQLRACFQVLDHVSQSVAQTGTVHQHAARGATAKTDNARLARQLVKYRPGESDDAGRPLTLDPEEIAQGRILQMHWTKSNYAPLPPFAWLRRRGYWIEHVRSVSADETQQARRDARIRQAEADLADVVATLADASNRGHYLTQRDLEDMGVLTEEGVKLSRARLREALSRGRMRGVLTLEPLPEGERKGLRREYLRAAS